MNIQELKSWIKDHQSNDYTIEELENGNIHLNTEYGYAEIRFNQIEDTAVIEFEITSNKEKDVVFYLHFELNDDEHTKQLYDEMVESLIALKEHKTLQVLLSCSSGLTTYLFSEKLNEAAATLGLDYHFEAVSYVSIYEEIQNYDVLLLAPQIGYMLNNYKKALPDKLVLQIPTAIFAAYNAVEGIQFLNSNLEKFIEEKKQEEEQSCCCVCHSKTILSISIVTNGKQTLMDYRLYANGEIIDSNQIIKTLYQMSDLYDIVDTMLLKHQKIDVIGIAAPGMVDTVDFEYMLIYEKNIKEVKNCMEKKYNVVCYVVNNANAAAVGFSLEHPEYANIIYHSQPFGCAVGGEGYIINHQLMSGKNGISGEIRFFIERMQYSNSFPRLPYSHQGALELVSNALLPAISIIGPEAIAIRSSMTADMEEVKKHLSSFIPENLLPDFYYIQDVTPYTLDGLMKLCVDYLENQDSKNDNN